MAVPKARISQNMMGRLRKDTTKATARERIKRRMDTAGTAILVRPVAANTRRCLMLPYKKGSSPDYRLHIQIRNRKCMEPSEETG